MYGGVVLARKMGFPEVILPGEVRNDLYLTLVAGEFARGSKTSDKNIEVTVAVCNELGAVVPGVLSLGAGAAAVNEYRSVTYYHDDRPKWNETFRVSWNERGNINLDNFSDPSPLHRSKCPSRSSNSAICGSTSSIAAPTRTRTRTRNRSASLTCA